MKGWTKLATLMTTDASGQDGDHAIDAVLDYPENGVVHKVLVEHFNPSDISVAAQIARIKGSDVQAMIAWTTGQPAATVFRAMIQGGLDVPVAPTSGNQTFIAMQRWESYCRSSSFSARRSTRRMTGYSRSIPGVEKVQREMYAALKAHNIKADNNVATSWDAGFIVVTALRKLGPTATAARLRGCTSTT